MKYLAYVFPLAMLVLKRDELHTLWLEQTRDIYAWQVSALMWVVAVAGMVICTLICAAYVVYDAIASVLRKKP